MRYLDIVKTHTREDAISFLIQAIRKFNSVGIFFLEENDILRIENILLNIK
jgi:hypothetical protein